MDDSAKQVTVIDDGVEVQRTIDDQSTATVVVYRLSTLASAPSVVQLEEGIPPRECIETLEFHPEHRPNDWMEGDGTVQFDVIVPPNQTRMVVLGLEADDEAPLVGDEPKITHLDLEVDDLRELNGSAPFTRGGSRDPPDEDRATVRGHEGEATADGGDTIADSDSDEVLDLPDPNADEEDPSDESDSDEVLNLPDPNADEDGPSADEEDPSDESDSDEVLNLPDPNADEPTTSGGEAEQSPDVDGGTEGESEEIGAGPSGEGHVDSAEPSGIGDIDDATDDSEFDDTAEGPGFDDDAQDSTFDDAAEGPGVDDATDDSGFDDTAEDRGLDDESEDGSAASADGESLVSDLLVDIRAGHASEEELDALRSELGVARADEVRFRHVQSRMSDFEAYVDALEGIINSHGTASEFVESIEAQVTDLEDELDEVRAEVSTVEEGLETADDDREQLTAEVADLDETMDELTDEVAELHDLVEAVDERTTTLETELRAEIEDLRDERAEQLDDIESELDAVQEQLEADFESEFDSLREDVESFNELRRRLLDAFGTGLDIEPEDDTAAGDEE